MKKILRKSEMFTVVLLMANLFLLNNAFGQTDPLYLQNTTTQSGTGTYVKDLTNTIGSSGSVTSQGTTSGTFAEQLAFTINVSNISPAISSGNSFPVSINVSNVSSTRSQAQFRLQRVNSAGAVQASTGYSSTFNNTGVQTATLSFGTTQTFSPTDRLRLSIEVRSTTGGSRTIAVNTGDASSIVGYPIVATSPYAMLTSGTFTVPTGVTSMTIEAWGAGGDGGSGYNFFGGTGSGGGGGGGGYRTYNYTGLTAGNTFTVTVGSGGNGNGGNTTIALTGQTNLVAIGGTAGGNAGYNSNGSLGSGGGTGSGPTGSNGVAGSAGANGSSNGGNGGKGATANGGPGGTGATGSVNAGTPGVPGGGGGGGSASINTPSNGANGQVIFTWVVCTTPTTYSVTGGGSYCTGGSGVAIGLANSETGVNYQLTVNSVNTGSAVTGTGTAISFGNQTTAGTYSVLATRVSGGCTNTMSGSAVISIKPLPAASVPNQSNISCYGGADGTITVSASNGTSPYTFSIDNGANYLPATGTNLRQFTGLLANTTYTIKVKDANGCISN